MVLGFIGYAFSRRNREAGERNGNDGEAEVSQLEKHAAAYPQAGDRAN